MLKDFMLDGWPCLQICHYTSTSISISFLCNNFCSVSGISMKFYMHTDIGKDF